MVRDAGAHRCGRRAAPPRSTAPGDCAGEAAGSTSKPVAARAGWQAGEDRGDGVPAGRTRGTAPGRSPHPLGGAPAMIVKLWGTRGSIATPGTETARYGGNTSCVEVRGPGETVLVLDAGTGIRRLGAHIKPSGRVDVLLTHLHMDHIQGLGFFKPLDEPDREVHIWGPPSTTLDLGARLSRYLSPPLF